MSSSARYYICSNLFALHSITAKDCKHLIVDAGHIAIESQLANKKAVQEIIAKRKQQYSDEDYRRLESLMYDKLTVRLESAQVLSLEQSLDDLPLNCP